MIRKRNLLKKIGVLSFALVCAITAFIVPSYAYTEDNQGNLVSDNLYNIGSYNESIGGVSFSVSNQTLTLNGTSTNGSWQNRNELSLTLKAGTYTIQWFTTYDKNDIGFGLRSSGSGLTELYQLNSQRYKTFTISQDTTFTTVIWWSTSGLIFDNVKVSCMVYKGNYKAYSAFEPYGKIYYSQNNYDNALNNDYGIFKLCSSIDLTLTWTDGSNKVDKYTWSSILNLMNEQPYIHCVNGTFSYDNHKLSTAFLDGTSNATAMWQFNFKNTYPLVKRFSSMIGSGYNLRYQIVDKNSSLFAYDNIDNDKIIDLTQYNDKQIGYIQLFTGNVNIAVSSTSLYISSDYNIAFTNGYNSGYEDGVKDGSEESLSIGYQEGYRDGKIEGYDEGYNEALGEDLSTRGFWGLLNSIFSFPVNMIKNVFNFEFMGINIASLITFIISIVIVALIVRKFTK